MTETPVSFINPDGTYAEGWLDRLDVDDAIKNDQQLRTHKGLADTAKNLHELMKLRGHHVVPIPPDGSQDPELWNQVYKRLGRPDAPEGYTKPNLEGFEPSQRMPDDMLDAVTKIMHKAGVSDRQWQTISADWNELVKTQLQAAETRRAEALNPLRDEWAGQFDANIALTEQFLKSSVPPERFDSALAAAKSHPDLLKLLHTQAKATVEGEPDLDNTPPAVLQQAEIELNKLTRGGQDGPYFNKYHPEHEAVIKRVADLRALLAKARPQKKQEQSFSLSV